MQLPRLLLLAALGFASVLHAQNQRPPAPPAAAAQFDFWLGEWDVTVPNGKLAGESRVDKISDGWGLLENWSSSNGGPGKSLNAYNAAKKQWQQFWVGAGGVLELSGGLDAAGHMVLTGETTGPGGHQTIERITWSPNPDGSVRQHWEQSTDAGVTWTTAFDGLYRRKSP